MSSKYPVAYAVGQKIKSLRKSQGYTVFQLAKEIDISEQQLFRYERGVNRIDIDCLVKVLEVLGVNIGSFFEEVTGGMAQETELNEQHIPAHFDSKALSIF
ncbi:MULTISPECIES: helix-turn-helix domain-containing protein [Proteus]|uniref:Helix-turn-helix transcriptional regulator n=1 Tax=Proteus penneri TaxID=102862 RepID=A0ABS0W294_9GAMM|nr:MULTISPECIES: helix-turn-helix transcriptional regulator [Proteus]EEG86028.1 DNA-binding helix-turn-helix protein [Proteus penneri ATCC 35198]MBJ2117020.1 helix-turn-helix transcriptional regulator [Proteus penneri]MCO8049322.1 helix-turn-helix domain-containing protein [Proteus penneri]MCX2587364.1 helix-turn-helix domain-containing protein [Proteus penneri]NBL78906.1 helix-turn-helix domain-containing protein [Proteus sp. G2672]